MGNASGKMRHQPARGRTCYGVRFSLAFWHEFLSFAFISVDAESRQGERGVVAYLVTAYQDHLTDSPHANEALLSKAVGILSRTDHAFNGAVPDPVCDEDMKVRCR